MATVLLTQHCGVCRGNIQRSTQLCKNYQLHWAWYGTPTFLNRVCTAVCGCVCVSMWSSTSYTSSNNKSVIHCESFSRQLWHADSYISYSTSTSCFSLLNISNFFWHCVTVPWLKVWWGFRQSKVRLICQEVIRPLAEVKQGFLRIGPNCKKFNSPSVKSVFGLLKIKKCNSLGLR